MLVERVKVTPVKYINEINVEKISDHIDSACSICYRESILKITNNIIWTDPREVSVDIPNLSEVEN